MFGIPADTALAWANVISLSGLAIAAAGAIVAYQLAARMNAAHSLELKQVQSEARTQIEIVAAEAHTHTAGLLKANEELQLELQSEREARKSEQTRDITDEQTAKFVDAVKGKVRQINVFTAPDREASIFGITILDALQKADVSVTWYRTQSLPTFAQGIADNGVTIYEYPAEQKDESAGRTLVKAFLAMGVQPNLLVPAQPLWDFPSPSLIIAPRRAPEFLRASKDPLPSATKSAALSDLLIQAE